MPPAARISDMHTCPMMNPGPVPHSGGPVLAGQVNVLTCAMPQARIGDQCICMGGVDAIAKGSLTVHVGAMPAARMGDMTVHGGVIVIGAPTVLIGDGANGGGGGGGAGMGMAVPVPFTAPDLQAQTMIGAHKEAKPFTRVCQK
jgi:uncharacterized Zn-binding protein involved in type VI secretion